VLSRTADVASGRRVPSHDWPLSAVDRVHEQVGALIQARTTARLVVRLAPRRWGMRGLVSEADHQAIHVGLLATSVLQLTQIIARALEGHDRLAEPVTTALADIAAAITVADSDPAAAMARADAVRDRVSALLTDAHDRSEVVLADVVEACVYD